MKRLGIVGGIGPESTIAYYRRLLAAHRERLPGRAPAVVINSIDPGVLSQIASNQLARVADYLVGEVRRLAAADVDVGLIAACTPHIVFDDVRQRSPIPLIDVMEATCEAACGAGLARLALFGTRFTMESERFRCQFARHGLELVAPDPADRTYIHRKYMTELLAGRIVPATHDGLLEIARRMKRARGIDALVLGGTELPLVVSDAEVDGMPVLDTTAIHVEAAMTALAS